MRLSEGCVCECVCVCEALWGELDVQTGSRLLMELQATRPLIEGEKVSD